MSENQEERIQLTCSGLKCDNETCDYEDPTAKVEEYKDYIDKPCPKCGENLLTQEDYDNTMAVIELTKMFNNMSEDFFKDLTDLPEEKKADANKQFCEENDLPIGTERVTMKLKIHKGVHIDSITPAKE